MVYRQPNPSPLFENRFDAGLKLAEKLSTYKNESVVVFAIPNGGLPVGLQVALALGAELDVVVARKLPIPLRPEGGFGAVADDGTTVLNHELVRSLGLTQSQITYQTSKVRNDIRQRSLAYRNSRAIPVVTGKIAIIVDDGLASGYTMMAAIESVRRRRPSRIVAAVPVASELAVRTISKMADNVITAHTALVPKFYVSYYYRFWNDMPEEEAIKCLREWEMRRFKATTKA
ncbi:phosphoribosyltransferase [Dehalogenimonas etheniformans]|uniref:Phosphoribosyl transferase n=1 Tax=Dehalogenimonas etheniformans TaxID=1536648 RepID=A0A2P5P989_9CHLR|nr:phosphoribosyltransferase family protein [Dehalogenimonas etheniformans]PPD58857.1 phosphoribosyl transferase [Dehalogenimonas etheniformans]QNT76375.1 phosphoribosyl transferase [Dehalogenimonas etheniformans]